jgi:hypothetical protein
LLSFDIIFSKKFYGWTDTKWYSEGTLEKEKNCLKNKVLKIERRSALLWKKCPTRRNENDALADTGERG